MNFKALMLRRFLVTLLQRSFLVLLLICLGCSAQSTSPDTPKAIERQVRSFYKLPPDVQVSIGSTKPSEFSGYDSIKLTFSKGTRKDEYDFLISKDAKTLIKMTKLDLTKDPNAEVMKKMDVKGRPTRGNKDAKVVIVNYDDFQCPFCSRMHQTLFPQIYKEYGDRVLFIYKDYPLAEIHPWAIHAAVNANCLAAQNNDAYWDFVDYLHGNQQVVNSQQGKEAQLAFLDRTTLLQGQQHNVDNAKLAACIKTQDETAVKASVQEGDALGVSATPTLFVNGEQLDGALPIAEVRAVLDRALTQAGVQPPVHPDTANTTGSGTAVK
jgi:protein-disulfide isomerase